MQVSRFKKYCWAIPALLASAQVLAWGQIGHRVTGAIAGQYLSAQAKAAVDNILPNEDLAEASTYADEMRSSPDIFWQKQASPYHYVTVPEGKTYADIIPPPEGDAVTALAKFSATVKDPEAALADKQLALRFIVHIIGDLHQPLHCGNGTDRGGNDVKLKFMWQDSNLHRVWDSAMIDHRQLSYSEWTNRLARKISNEQAQKWANPKPSAWIAESIKIRDAIYPEQNEVSWDYLYQNIPTAKQRMQMAGVRIAAYLNQLFEK